ncbi:aminotransferase class I/II-fold pyridoxal phosphate-dependent enzyme [Numidum massiliense]|uniref:aminotransferase class I/II-fold pyridoxal phosphate-dependent enzyme n=1 Tax=Numidum massiliense TaxID=1522315 RepID=UPI0006D52E86|nr:aminotransferase class I/II-fold pyridoxal phosphate-dependent enzyme [Numidum massiliense]
MHIETTLCQAGVDREERTGAVSYPLYLSTAYRHPAIGESTGFDYARTANPTRQQVEQVLAELEGGCRALAFSSGMAAIHALQSLFSSGDEIITPLDLYGGTYRLFATTFRQAGIVVKTVDLREAGAVAAAMTSRTKAVFLETPSNPLMHVIDIAAVAAIAKAHGAWTIVDNTFLTPYVQQPLALGADLVVHSATKYLSGHNDVLAGALVCTDEALGEQLHAVQNATGAVLSPFDSWLLLRGLKTLALRMARHESNAKHVVRFLRQHPLVTDVYYPQVYRSPDALKKQTLGQRQPHGMPSTEEAVFVDWRDHPMGRATISSEKPLFSNESLSAGGDFSTDETDDLYRCGGGMISFKVRDRRLIPHILQQLQVIAFAESLGGVESFMTYPTTQTHADVPEEVRERIGVSDDLLRLSVGIEHVDDLCADLAQAFAFAERCSPRGV